ncbi:hypothetical protein K9M48_02945 [Candidatus Gracilibacteria bacterium]|nr:hypothetical protein [Candidatus Gracilibacteria bacterium]
MKFKIVYLFIHIFVLALGASVFGQGLQLGQNQTILNTDSENALNVYDNNNPISDPIREGAFKIIDADATNTISSDELNGIANPGLISDHSTALGETMSIVKNIINYTLGLIGLVALVYLIYHGFLMVTAAGNDAQYKKGIKGLQTAVIALAGVGLSRLVVSFIFWIIAYIS